MVCRQDSIEPVGERVALVELAVARHLALSVIQVAFHFCNTRSCRSTVVQLTALVGGPTHANRIGFHATKEV